MPRNTDVEAELAEVRAELAAAEDPSAVVRQITTRLWGRDAERFYRACQNMGEIPAEAARLMLTAQLTPGTVTVQLSAPQRELFRSIVEATGAQNVSEVIRELIRRFGPVLIQEARGCAQPNTEAV